MSIPVKTFEIRIYPDDENLLNKIVRQGIKNEIIDPYDGMSASEIKELDERVYQIGDYEYLEHRIMKDGDVAKLYIKDYEEKEYFATDIVLDNKMKFYLENRNKLRVEQKLFLKGGKYKYVSGGTISTDEIPLFLLLDISMYNKEG